MSAQYSIEQRRASLVSAALRHIRDAEHLAAQGPHRSLDQAYHLAGFAPECARKACLAESWADKALGHDFAGKAEQILDVILALDAHAHRYRPSEWHTRYPAFDQWKVESRYWRTGEAEERATQALLEEARRAVDEVVLVLWANGALPHEALT